VSKQWWLTTEDTESLRCTEGEQSEERYWAFCLGAWIALNGLFVSKCNIVLPSYLY